LEELENGRGVTEISKAAGRDIRVVKRHIEIALEERQIAQVKRDFLLGRLQEHQEDLLAEARRLREAIVRYPPRPLEPEAPMEQKVHEALKEHARRLPLQRLLESYHLAFAEYKRHRDNVGNELVQKEVDLLSGLREEAVTYPWAPRVIEVLEKREPLLMSSDRSYMENKVKDDTYEPSWGDFKLTRSRVPRAILSAVFEAHRELLSHAEQYLPGFEEHRQHLKSLADLIVEELDAFQLKRLVPGRCRYCPL
jgi:hypothetical protein